MEVPETFRGMKKVKEYPNFVLYIDELRKKRMFSILGFRTYRTKKNKTRLSQCVGWITKEE